MGSKYLTSLADWCREAGLHVHEVDGWQSRARSSGGYESGRPWAIMWHHTASSTSPQNDVNYICYGCPDAPVSNLYLDRDGHVWVCAGGATNTNGKGGPVGFSKGNVPLDSMNTYAVSIEAGNNGIGEPWPQVQIDAYFTLNTTLAAKLGLNPDDCCTHHQWAPTRKIDPATAAAVQGPWQPGSVTSSGTWSQPDLEHECSERAGNRPPPVDPPPGPVKPGYPVPAPTKDDDSMVVALDSNGTAWIGNGFERQPITSEEIFFTQILLAKEGCYRFVNTSGEGVNGWENVYTVPQNVIEALGRVVA